MNGHRIIRKGNGARPNHNGTQKDLPAWFKAIPYPPNFGMFSKPQKPIKPNK